MIYKSDVLNAMQSNPFDGVAEQLDAVEHMTGLINAFFQGAEQQDVATAMLGALMLRRVSDAFLAAIQAADVRN
jgi:hypothetical protein